MIGGSNRLLTTREAAEYLSVPLKTLQTRWRDWELPALRVGRGLRFRERDLEGWLDRNQAS